jgi:hypothetical protein
VGVALIGWEAGPENVIQLAGVDPLVGHHVIDLRPDATSTGGWAIALLDDADIPNNARVIASDALDKSTWTATNRNRVGNALGLTLDSQRLDQAALELLLVHGDDARADRWNRLRPCQGVYEVWLRDLMIAVPKVSGGSALFENFTKADSTTLGPTYTWTEYGTGNAQVQSNFVRTTTLQAWARARCDTALGGSEQWSEVRFSIATNGGHGMGGSAVRYNGSADTCYLGGRVDTVPTGASNFNRITKCVTGTLTSLGTTAFTWAQGVTYFIRTTCQGSTLVVTINGGTRLTITDTSITSGNYAGFEVSAFTAVTRGNVEDWWASDIVWPLQRDLNISQGVMRAAVR